MVALRGRALYASTLNEPHDYHHKRDNQENVNNSAKCVRGDQTEQPKNQQNNPYSPKHFRFTSFDWHNAPCCGP